MKKILTFPLILILGFALTKLQPANINKVAPSPASILGATSSQDIQFTVNVPAVFKKDIVAPNIVYSVKPGSGISISEGQSPTITNTGVTSLQSKTGSLNLEAGSGIAIDGLKISNTGITSLSAGTGISVDGNKITNTGILSLVAGTNITVDGNKITNAQEPPDYTKSGWTDSGTTVTLTTLTDAVTMGTVTFGNATISDDSTITPTSDLTSSLGDATHRFNNLWVAHINGDSSQSFAGQTIFSYQPTDATFGQASVRINPASSAANGQLLGFGLAGYQRAVVDEDGDIILGYNDATSAPVTDSPLTIYGHNGTIVSSIDTNGNLTMGNTITPNGTLTIESSVNTSGLNVNSNVLYVSDKVGIGTANPTQILTVNGNTQAAIGYTGTLYNRTANTTNLAFSGNNINFLNNNTSTLYTSSNNRVGIGNTTPTATLDVTGTTNISGATTLGSTLNVTGTTTLSTITASSANISGNLTTSGATNSVTGNVGIGTTAPTAQMDIAATLGTDAVRLTHSGAKVLGMYTNSNGITMDLIGTDPNNKLTNGTFESNVNSWNATQQYTLNDEFSDALPATLATTSPITIASGGVSNPTPVLGSEVATFANATSDPNGNEANTTTNWGTGSDNTITSDSTEKYAGTYSLKSIRTQSVGSGQVVYNFTPAANAWYLITGNIKPTAGTGYFHPWVSNFTGGSQVNFPAIGSWSAFSLSGRSTTTATVTFRAYHNSIGSTFYLDNFSIKPLSLSSLLSTVSTSSSSDITVSADTTLTAGTQAGVVMNLDNATNPQNFIIAYHDGSKIHLDKNVGGTYTSLINTTAAYSAGSNIKITRTGNSYSLYYGGVQKGTTQTITDSGIINNTIHGVFSTYASNSFANFLVQNVISNPIPIAGSEMAPDNTATSTVTEVDNTTGFTQDGATLTTVADNRPGSIGTRALNNLAAGGSSGMYMTYAGVTGQWYILNEWLKSNDGQSSGVYNTSIPINLYPLYVGTSSWANYIYSFRAGSGTKSLKLYSMTAGKNMLFDDISLKPLTTSSLFSTVSTSASTDYTVQANITMTAGTHAGLVMNLDSDSNPQNFVIAYFDGHKAYLDKVVNGTYTSVIGQTAMTYSAGATLKVVKNGTNYSLFYNGTQIGTTQTISDASIISNTRHGVFSTYATNSFTNFQVLGGVNGTLATDGTNTRTVYDTNGALSASSGKAVLTNGGGSTGNPALYYPTITRINGLTLTGSANVSATSSNWYQMGFDTDNTYGIANGIILNNGGIRISDYSNPVVGAWSLSTDYQLATVLRSTGAYYFIKGGSFTNWSLLYISSVTNTANMYPTFSGVSAVIGTADNLRIAKEIFTPTPLAYDTFTRADGAIGTSETTGPDSQTTPGLSWTGSTWTISTNKTMNTPNLGSDVALNGTFADTSNWIIEPNSGWEISSGTANHTSDGSNSVYQNTLIIGTWYQANFDLLNWSASTGGLSLGGTSFYKGANGSYTFTGRPTTARLSITGNTPFRGSIDNVVVKPLTLPELFSSVSTSDKDIIASADVTMITGTQAGLVTNLDSTTTPNNFLIAYHDGTNVHLDKAVSERIVNGGFETAGSPFGSWGVENSGGGSVVDEQTYVHTNSHASKLVKGSSGATDIYQAFPVTAGVTYNLSFWTRGDGSNDGRYLVQNNNTGVPIISSTYTGITSTTYSQVSTSFTVPAGCSQAQLYLYSPVSAGGAAYFDDVSVIPTTSDPIYTSLINTATTYSTGATMRVIPYHSDANTMKVRVYYNNALVGTEQTITDAGVISNIKHGLFSTYSGNSFDNYTLFARGSDGEYSQLTPADLTVTRDTDTKYAGSASSAKIVAGATDNDFTQSVNVGDTNSYTLTAYVYTDGSAVTSADAELYYDTTTLATTYTSAGWNGWYKLTGTLTGVASNKLYGLRVKAGKTIYVDNITLTSGSTSATTTYVYNSGSGKANLSVQGMIDGTVKGVATFSKAGTVSDADFSSVANGLLAVDSTNHRVYFREGGTWSYLAKTGGFQIPSEEVGDLSIGNLLIPYVESKLEDGALHGLYKGFSDIVSGGKAIISTGTDQVAITFSKPFSHIPAIYITPIGSSNDFNIKDISEKGFTLQLDVLAPEDYIYLWSALDSQ